MTNWIKHNGGPQPVADDVWVEVGKTKRAQGYFTADVTHYRSDPASIMDWSDVFEYRILNQHLIDAKQAEIDALKEDLAIWDSVFPDLLPDRLKSDKQLAEEDVAAKIDAARLEGIRLGLEAAHKAICALPVTPESDPERVQDDCADSIAYDLMINIEIIAREAADKETAR